MQVCFRSRKDARRWRPNDTIGYSTSYLRWQPTTVLPPTTRTSQYRSMYLRTWGTRSRLPPDRADKAHPAVQRHTVRRRRPAYASLSWPAHATKVIHVTIPMAMQLAALFSPCGESRQQCTGAQGRGQVSLTVSVTWTTNKCGLAGAGRSVVQAF